MVGMVCGGPSGKGNLGAGSPHIQGGLWPFRYRIKPWLFSLLQGTLRLVLLAYERVLSIAVLQYCRSLDSWEQALERVHLYSLPKSWGHQIYGPANHCFIGSSPNCSHLLVKSWVNQRSYTFRARRNLRPALSVYKQKCNWQKKMQLWEVVAFPGPPSQDTSLIFII